MLRNFRNFHTSKKSANCLRHKIGAIIADENRRIISTGYNGTPGNFQPCNEGGCKRCWDVKIPSGERLDECICIHAEESALLEAGRRRCAGSTLYITHSPCRSCAKKIIHMGIKKVIFVVEYKSSLEEITNIFESAKVELCKKDMPCLPLLRLQEK